MSEDRTTTERRLYMRSIRRGIKEMDIILGSFAGDALTGLSDDDLTLYDRMLAENDHDLYAWVSGAQVPDPTYAALIAQVQDHMAAQKNAPT
ncbi:MAG: succinate dehydrogenase assembly factor 2 [Shimia sp.]